MAKIIVEMNKSEYKAVCTEIRDWYQLNLKPEQMKKILADNTKLLIEVAEDVIVESKYKGLGSTYVREEVIDHIALKLTKQEWPMGGNRSKAKREFYDKFAKVCKQKGYDFYEDAYIEY